MDMHARAMQGTLPQLTLPADRGHAHFLERAVSRRALLTGGAAALVAVAARPAGAAGDRRPKPIPGGLGPYWHIYPNAYLPGGVLPEQSTITDYKGVFGSCQVTGWGRDNRGRELYFDSDMRFMQGRYVARDGVERYGTFGFI